MTNQKIDKVWKALAKYGIHSEKELDEALKNMKPLNISCMVSSLKTVQEGGQAQYMQAAEMAGMK